MADEEYTAVMEECRQNCKGLGSRCGVFGFVAEKDGIWLGCEREGK